MKTQTNKSHTGQVDLPSFLSLLESILAKATISNKERSTNHDHARHS